MNQTEAESVKDLAKTVVEALPRITERKCSECKGKKWISTPDFDDSSKEDFIDKCRSCSGTGKVSWKWKPKVGEWCILPSKDTILIHTIKAEMIRYIRHYALYDEEIISHKDCVIPILHWEEIERVLRKAGVVLELLRKPNKSWLVWKHTCSLRALEGYKETFAVSSEWCDTRQEAVMRSVVALGKEIDAKGK